MSALMDRTFALGSSAAVLGWLLLAAAPLARSWAGRLRGLAGVAIPALLGVGYAVVIGMRWDSAPGSYGSIAAVRTLFADDGLLLAGWLHYLAFDLFIGGWIAREGVRREVPHWLLLPCFGLTFLFGPIGLLLFLFVRAVASRARVVGVKS